MFTLSLSQPAGAGGVRFTAATANGTAVAGSDYVALPATSVQIAAGERTATVAVEVLGDTTPEPDETFTLQISGLTGALPATLSATGTIVNDDFQLLPIHAIQGKGARSPLEGQVVATSGIVTARRSAGFSCRHRRPKPMPTRPPPKACMCIPAAPRRTPPPSATGCACRAR